MGQTEQYVIASGDPVSGFTYVGPFTGYEVADDWAETNLSDADWWLILLETPA